VRSATSADPVVRAATKATTPDLDVLAAFDDYLAAQMERRNAQEIKANPAANTYAIVSKGEAVETLVADWERRHTALKRACPAIWKQRREDYIRQIGQRR
jgi:hypothetical protein